MEAAGEKAAATQVEATEEETAAAIEMEAAEEKAAATQVKVAEEETTAAIN